MSKKKTAESYSKGSEDASSLYSLGPEFLEAARVLRDTPAKSTKYESVIYYLLGHAAELFLKAYLHAHQVPIKTLANIGHDLIALVDLADEHGMTAQVHWGAVRMLNPLYNAKVLEYRDQKAKTFPHMDDLFHEVKRLDAIAFDAVSQPFFNNKNGSS